MSGKAFKCNLCSKEFASNYNLNAHIERQHEAVRDNKKKKSNCNVCGDKFINGTSLINHMMIHTGERPFKCAVDGCEMAFRQKITLKDHIKFKHSNERPFKCDFPGCLYSAKTRPNLLSHKKSHSDERRFACTNVGCSFRAKWKSSINSHEKFVHSEFKAFACTKCGYKAALHNSLKRHMRRHSSRRDFKCSNPNCTESFKSSYALKYHFTNVHGEWNIPCDKPGCGRKFANALALWNHKRNFHSKKSYACPNLNCKYTTSIPHNLTHHMIIHEGKNEKISCPIKGCEYKGKNSRAVKAHMGRHGSLLKCPVSGCGRYVETKGALKNHMKLHNPSGRPFQCPLCFKRFLKQIQLNAHALVHTDEKPFRCGHCEYATSFRGSVRNHISSIHPSLPFPFIVILPLNDRECIRCKVTLPSGEFIVHSMRHLAPVIMIERLEIK